MASFVGANAANSDNSTNLVTVSAPTHSNGDFLIQFIGYADNTLDSVSNGLATEITLVNDAAAFDTAVQVAWQTASSEPAVYSVSCDDALTDHQCIIMAAFENIASAPFDIAYNSADHYVKQTNTASPQAQPITASADGGLALVFQYVTESNVTDLVAPSGYSEATQTLGNHRNAGLWYRSVGAGVETPGVQNHTGALGTEEVVSITMLLRSAGANVTVSLDTESLVFTGQPVSYFIGSLFAGTHTIGERCTIDNSPIAERVRFI